MSFNPTCLSLKENKEFKWKGQLFFPGIFDGIHIFELEELEPGKTRFVQREEFQGIPVGILWKKLDTYKKRL